MQNLKFTLRKYMFLIISLIFLSSCEKDETSGNDKALLIFFQYEYMNWAWGYSHEGWFIDNLGNIKGYNLPDDWKWTDSSGYIAYDSLIYNYYQTDTLLGQIDLPKLNEKADLIEGTIDGQLSKIYCHGADIGSFALYCYYWDSEKNNFKRQLLSLGGDCEQINMTPEAIQLTEFLNQINR